MKRKSQKKSLKKAKQDLVEQSDIISESVKFWGEEMDKVFNEIDHWEQREDDPLYEEKMTELIAQLEALLVRGEKESEILTQMENDLNKLFEAAKVEKSDNKAEFINYFRGMTADKKR